jgi:CRP/FNR family transcriptional regulator
MPYQFLVLPKTRRRRRKIQGPQPRAGSRTALQPDERRGAKATQDEGPLRSLPQDVRDAMDAISCSATYQKGTVLFIEGQRPCGVFLLREGQVKLSTSSADGRLVIVGRAGPGEILGLPAAISGKPHEVTAEAMRTLRCDFIARDALLQFLQEHGDAAFRVAKILSSMYDAAFNHVRSMGLSASATERLVRLILDLPPADPQSNGHTKTIPLTHKEIAEMIGSSRETVTRLFTRFKREQLVQVDDSRLHILDREGLEQLLQV